MKLIDTTKKFLKFEVGNGDNIHMWLDLWHPAGILIKQYGFRVVYDVQSNIEAKLSFVICNEDWLWRPARSEALVDIQAKLSKVSLGQCDKPIWLFLRRVSMLVLRLGKHLERRMQRLFGGRWFGFLWLFLNMPLSFGLQ